MYGIGFKQILEFIIFTLYFKNISARNLINDRAVIEDSFKELLSNDNPVRGTIDLYEVDDHATICWNEKTTLHFYTNGTNYGYVEYSISLELNPEELVHPAYDVPKETYEVFNVELQGSQLLDFITVLSNNDETVKENKTVICKSGKAFRKTFKELTDRKKVEVIIKKAENSVTWKEVAGNGSFDGIDSEASKEKQSSEDFGANGQSSQSGVSGTLEQREHSEDSGALEQNRQSEDSGPFEQKQQSEDDLTNQDGASDTERKSSANFGQGGLSDTLSTRIAFSEDDMVGAFESDTTKAPEIDVQNSVNQDGSSFGGTSGSSGSDLGGEGELESRSFGAQTDGENKALPLNESSGNNTVVNILRDAKEADGDLMVKQENPMVQENSEQLSSESANDESLVEARNLGNTDSGNEDDCSKTGKVKIKLSLDVEDDGGKSNEVAQDIELDLNRPFESQTFSAKSNNEILSTLIAQYYNKALAKHTLCLKKKNKVPQAETAFRFFADPQQDSSHQNAYANDPNIYANVYPNDPNPFSNLQSVYANVPNPYANMYPNGQRFQVSDPNLYANMYPHGQQFQLNDPNLYANVPNFYPNVPNVYDQTSLYVVPNGMYYMAPRSFEEPQSNQTSWTDTLKDMFSIEKIKSKLFA